MENIIFHIDVNNAFLSWTAVKLLNSGYKYDIRNSYAIIGGDESGRHGIVLAKSTPAKKLGIKTAETIYSAKKKCRVLKVYPPDYELYRRMSKSLFNLLSKYTCDIEIASIDECYLDYGKVKNLYGDEILFAEKLKKEIYDTLGFTVNIGIANNKLCAKMASDFSKPNKIHTLYKSEIETKMWPLDVGELFGIGKKTEEKLHHMGIHTIHDLAFANENKLSITFKNMAKNMIDSANGIDSSRVITYEEVKGIGNEITLSKDVSNRSELHKCLFSLANKVASRIRGENKYAYVVVVTLKDTYFKRKSHQKKLKNATNTTNEIYEVSKKIFDEMWNGEPVRLIGIRLDNLVVNNFHQVSLFEEITNKVDDEKLEKLLDSLQKKYGKNVIDKASLK